VHSIWVCLIILALAPRAWAQSARAEEDAFSGANLQLDAPARADAAGPQRILAVQVEMDGAPADAQPSTTASLLGQTYSPALVRGALA
jgi:hypothetical protein